MLKEAGVKVTDRIKRRLMKPSTTTSVSSPVMDVVLQIGEKLEKKSKTTKK